MNNLGAATVESDKHSIKFDVDVVSLDEILNSQEVSCIKVDVEGHELKVLMGAISTLRRCSPLIALEIHRDKIENGRSESLDFLSSLGYRFFYTVPRREPPNLISRREFTRVFYDIFFSVLNQKIASDLVTLNITSLIPKNYNMIFASTTSVSISS
jgi:hypothetical protein